MHDPCGLPWSWGATPAQVAARYPADDALAGETLALTRAVRVQAPVEVSYRWLCQLSTAPYSYDWLDNRGRRSPRTLTVGADDLRIGQRLMTVWEVTEVAPGHQWSARSTARAERIFGAMAVTYAAEPEGPDSSTLVCRMVVAAAGSVRRARAYMFAWGDVPMMRRQLLNLKARAERDARL